MTEGISLREHLERIGKIGTRERKKRGDSEYYRKLQEKSVSARNQNKLEVIEKPKFGIV